MRRSGFLILVVILALVLNQDLQLRRRIEDGASRLLQGSKPETSEEDEEALTTDDDEESWIQ